LVLAGIFVMGPYVIRSINAHFKTLEEDVQYSVAEPIRQGPPTGYQFPTCTCDPLFNKACGDGTNCPLTQEYWYKNCNPVGCENYFYDVCPPPVGPTFDIANAGCWVGQACRYNLSSNWPVLKCCTAWVDTGRCGANAATANGGNIAAGCPDGVMEQTRDCGSFPTVTEYRCEVDDVGNPVISDECRFGCGYLMINTFGDPKDGPLVGGGNTPPPLWYDDIDGNNSRGGAEPQSSWCDPHSSYPNWPNQIGLLSDTDIVYFDYRTGGCPAAGGRCQALCPNGYWINTDANGCYDPWGPTIPLYENPKGCYVDSMRPLGGNFQCIDEDGGGCGSVGGFFGGGGGGGGGGGPPPNLPLCSPAGPVAYCIDPNIDPNHPVYGALVPLYRINQGCENDNGMTSNPTCATESCEEACNSGGYNTTVCTTVYKDCDTYTCIGGGSTCSNSQYCYMFPPVDPSTLPRPGMIPVYQTAPGCFNNGSYYIWGNTCLSGTCGGSSGYVSWSCYVDCNGNCPCAGSDTGPYVPNTCANPVAGYVYPP
jgi:hypothetical protein